MKNLLKINKLFVRVRITKNQATKKDKLMKKEAELDDKFIKLSKQEIESKQKELQQKIVEQEQKKLLFKNNDISLEKRIHTHTLLAYQQELFKSPTDLTQNPLSTYEILNQKILDCQEQTIEVIKKREQQERERYNQLSILETEGLKDREVKRYIGTMNAERYINEQYNVEKKENVPLNSRRVGAIGYKIGMTHAYDKWGFHIPLTAIKIDRCQVIGHKVKEINGYDSLVLGAGQKSLKGLRKHRIGIFLKANVQPKLDIKEFRIDRDNFLPIGYMIGVRHFTAGQFVDIQAKTKGKGFMGVMKAHGFKGQPQTHGTHGTHRSPGSIGARQDPGKVWKKKKMPGRHGYKPRIHRKQQIYKIDFPRSIIYIKGSVPGATGRMIKITDTWYHRQLNEGLLNYPTFIYEKDKIYPDYLEMDPPLQDPAELWEHENEVLDFKETDLDEVEEELF